MLICRIKGSRCALSQGKYRNESKSRRMTEARGLPGSLYSASTIVYARTQTYTPPCEQLWKLSRCAECLRAVRKLSASSESVLGGWWWKRKDRRLKCRFRATLEPRKHLNLPCSHSHAFIFSRAHPKPPLLLRFTFSHPRSLASSVSHLLDTRVFVPLTAVLPLVSCVPDPPIYLALRLTLGLL